MNKRRREEDPSRYPLFQQHLRAGCPDPCQVYHFGGYNPTLPYPCATWRCKVGQSCNAKDRLPASFPRTGSCLRQRYAVYVIKRGGHVQHGSWKVPTCCPETSKRPSRHITSFSLGTPFTPSVCVASTSSGISSLSLTPPTPFHLCLNH